MNDFKLRIATPNGSVFDGRAVKLDVRGVAGDLAVMAGHIPFITAVVGGRCHVMTEESDLNGTIDGGLLNVMKNETVLLVGRYTPDSDQ